MYSSFNTTVILSPFDLKTLPPALPASGRPSTPMSPGTVTLVAGGISNAAGRPFYKKTSPCPVDSGRTTLDISESCLLSTGKDQRVHQYVINSSPFLQSFLLVIMVCLVIPQTPPAPGTNLSTLSPRSYLLDPGVFTSLKCKLSLELSPSHRASLNFDPPALGQHQTVSDYQRDAGYLDADARPMIKLQLPFEPTLDKFHEKKLVVLTCA